MKNTGEKRRIDCKKLKKNFQIQTSYFIFPLSIIFLLFQQFYKTSILYNCVQSYKYGLFADLKSNIMQKNIGHISEAVLIMQIQKNEESPI
jgi:hypothetical protein